MIDAKSYDEQIKAIRAYNQPILEDFQAWLKQSGLSEKTIRSHVFNISFFTEYLVYYEPLKKLDEAGSGDVWSFLANWYPRKALWSSRGGVKSNMASFKKFFQWLGETGSISPETVAAVFSTLKEGREEFLASVDEY